MAWTSGRDRVIVVTATREGQGALSSSGPTNP